MTLRTFGLLPVLGVLLRAAPGLAQTLASPRMAVPVAAPLSADTGTVFELSRCVALALENNQQVRQADWQAQTNRVGVTTAWGNLLPNLNGTVTHGLNRGRSIDPFTNAYANQQISFANYDLNATVPVWNGLSLQNTLHQNRLTTEAARLDLQQTRDNTIISVILAYFQVLNADEQLRQAERQAAVTARQVARLRVLDSTGAIAPALLYDLRGQLATDHLTVVAMRTTAQTARLTLAQLLNIAFTPTMRLGPPPETAGAAGPTPTDFGAVVQNALATLPQVRAAQLRLRSAHSGVRAARGQWWPSVYLFGNAGTTYSSAALRATGGGTTTETIPYRDQWRNNRFSTFGVGVRIPLLNGLQTRTRVGFARIAEEQARFQVKTVENTVQQTVTQAILNEQQAQERYRTLGQQVQDFARSFQAAEARFEAGVGNAVDYMVAKTNADRARTNLIAARYEVALRRQIVAYYEGQALP